MFINLSKRTFAAVFVTLAIASAAVAQQVSTPDLTAQAASVTEFDVNGLKVILRRRASAPTVAVGLFLRGGVRNLTDKTAGIESLMLTSAIEAGQNFPRQSVRRELARTGSTLGASAGSDFSVISLASTRENFDRTWKLFTDVTMKPLFDPADINRVRDQMISGLREQETVPNERSRDARKQDSLRGASVFDGPDRNARNRYRRSRPHSFAIITSVRWKLLSCCWLSLAT